MDSATLIARHTRLSILAAPLLLCGAPSAFATPPAEQAVTESAVSTETTAEDVGLKVVHQVAAEYPARARGQNYGVQKCVAHVWIDAEGTPERVKIDKCLALFHRATKDAVMAWRWSPPTLQGVPVASRAKLTFDFSDACVTGAAPCDSGFDDSFFIQAPSGNAPTENVPDSPARRRRR